MKHVLLCGLFMVVASELQSQTPEGPTPAEAKEYLTVAANTPPSKADYGDPRLVANLACGIDYQNALKGVLQKEAAALKQLLLSSACIVHASGAGKVHADILRATLAYIGDADFSEALKSLPGYVVSRVDSNMFDVGIGSSEAYHKHVQRAYPKTWAFLKRE